MCSSTLFHLWPPEDPTRYPHRLSTTSSTLSSTCSPCSFHSRAQLDVDSCVFYHFHVTPNKHTGWRPLQTANTGTNVPLKTQLLVSIRKARHVSSISFSFWITSVLLRPSACMKVLWFDSSAMTTWGNRCLWNESQGRFSEAWKDTQWSPCAADSRLRLYGTRASGELRQPPVSSPQGIRYPQLDNDIRTYCSLLLRGEKNWTCLVITGVLMLAVLSEDAVLCHYCAPALIIDSIKMAVKLDVPISSGACCLF